jgi:hypothetical protein
MGLIRQGVLGGFRKKTGAVVGAYWRKLDVIRALPRSSGKAPTQLQIEHKQKFAMATSFLLKASGLIKAGFRSEDTLTPMNKALAYHLKEAVIGAWPDFAIDMEKFRYSIGNLEMPDTIGTEVLGDGKVRFEWDRTTDSDDFIKPSDTVTVVAYNSDKQRFVKKVAATTRGTGEYELQLPEVFAGDTLYLYISFSSVTKKINSESRYLGTVTLPL